MSFNILDASEKRRMRQRALCADFSKIDSMLIERIVPVNLVPNSKYPAWSDGSRITFSETALDTETVEDIIAANGLNYHELAHLLYTPRMGDPLQSWLARKGKQERLVFNILEDSRIERLMTSKYAATRPYFLHTVIKYALDKEGVGTGQEIAMLHLLTHSRRYIPADLRQEYRRQFISEFGKDSETKVTEALESYSRSNPSLSTGNAKMQGCITTIVMFMARFNNPPLPDKNHEGVDSAPSTQPNYGAPSKGHGKDINEANKQEDTEDAEDGNGSGSGRDQESDDSDGPEDDSAEPSGSAGPDEEEGEGSDREGDDTEGSSDGDRDGAGEPSEENGGSSAGTGDGAPLRPTDVQERLKETLNNIANNPEVAHDVAQTQRLLKEGRNASRVSPLEDMTSVLVPPAPSNVLAAKRMTREFSKIVEDADPGMKTYQSSGKVNMKRAMSDSDPDTVFDLWDEGQVDSSDFELVLLVDRSGSMSAKQGEACQAAWSILYGVEQLGANVKSTYIAFETNCTIVKSRNERTGPKVLNYKSTGGTSPILALEEAAVIFQSSPKRRGVLIILTDGQWNDTDGCDEYIARMKGAGIVTALAGMYSGGLSNMYSDDGLPNTGDDHGCEVYARINEPAELVPFAREVVKITMKRTVKR